MKQCKTKVLYVLAVSLCLLLIGCGLQKAENITLPANAEISAVVVTNAHVITSHTDAEWIAAFTEAILAAEPTAVQSVQDVPQVEAYSKIDLMLTEESITVFCYEKHGSYYVELPYQGIYEADVTLQRLVEL